MNTMSVLLNIIIPKVRKSKIKYIPLIYKFIVRDWKTQINLSIDFFFFLHSFIAFYWFSCITNFKKCTSQMYAILCITFSFLFLSKMYALPNYFGRNKKYKKLLERTVQIVSWCVWARSVKTRDTISRSWLWVGRNRLCTHWLWQRERGLGLGLASCCQLPPWILPCTADFLLKK